MSYTSGFFDAVDLGEGQYDRVYSSAEFAHFFGLFVGNGVFPSPSTGLSVVCNTPQDMTIKVSPGSGFINGHYLSVPEGGDEYLTLPIAHPSLPRIDSIIMGLDLGERQVTLYVKPGQAAAAPEPVALQRDDTIYELELARITLLAGAGSISQPDILDTRPDPDRCGLVTGLIDQFDVSGFFQAAYASFEEWFEGIKGQVDEDVATSLQLQVNELREQLNQDREKTLSAETKELMGLPPEATPSEAFLMLYESSGGAVRRNRPPLATDAEEVGKLWVIPKMTFNNLMPGAITQATNNWRTSTATLTASGNSLTTVGNASSNQTRVEATLSRSVTPGDKIFVQLKVDVNHDANTMVAELVVGETVLETQSLEFPAAGNVLSFQALTTTEVSGTPVLKLYSTYNTAAVQSGKGFTVSNITVWNLTSDMCEAQEDNEFSEVEAANYLSTYGQFQSREYEFSTWWWILQGVTSGVYFWSRMFDEATTAEATGGTNQTSWMSPLRTQEFLTSRLATQDEVNGGTNNSKVITPATAAGLFTNKLATTAEAQAGSVDTKWMSPLKARQHFNALAASDSDVTTGTNTTKWTNPKQVAKAATTVFDASTQELIQLETAPKVCSIAATTGGTYVTAFYGNDSNRSTAYYMCVWQNQLFLFGTYVPSSNQYAPGVIVFDSTGKYSTQFRQASLTMGSDYSSANALQGVAVSSDGSAVRTSCGSYYTIVDLAKRTISYHSSSGTYAGCGLTTNYQFYFYNNSYNSRSIGYASRGSGTSSFKTLSIGNGANSSYYTATPIGVSGDTIWYVEQSGQAQYKLSKAVMGGTPTYTSGVATFNGSSLSMTYMDLQFLFCNKDYAYLCVRGSVSDQSRLAKYALKVSLADGSTNWSTVTSGGTTASQSNAYSYTNQSYYMGSTETAAYFFGESYGVVILNKSTAAWSTHAWPTGVRPHWASTQAYGYESVFSGNYNGYILHGDCMYSTETFQNIGIQGPPSIVKSTSYFYGVVDSYSSPSYGGQVHFTGPINSAGPVGYTGSYSSTATQILVGPPARTVSGTRAQEV